ncbi:hypothetical protein sos41_18600 [Alphaproteobacteria bacterium SO-S41]|nr:hypothetical protein sos41_18600 [Alphaproteobacteria bacterium SO-S41]
MTPLFRTLAAALLLTGIVAALIAGRVMLLANGREIVVAAQPVDPRDLFRGDYVALNYDFTSVTSPGLAEDTAPTRDFNRYRDRTVYVVLKPDGAHYVFDYASRVKPDVPADRVVLRGEATSSARTSATLRYGIEQYFVPEGHARAIEENLRDKRIDVVLAVAADGTAAIKALRLDGQDIYREGLF